MYIKRFNRLLNELSWNKHEIEHNARACYQIIQHILNENAGFFSWYEMRKVLKKKWMKILPKN